MPPAYKLMITSLDFSSPREPFGIVVGKKAIAILRDGDIFWAVV
ncbi:hypothetical protein [Corynebacterium stationis]|nr:hypothetical protein [Corynebacterium stationis]